MSSVPHMLAEIREQPDVLERVLANVGDALRSEAARRSETVPTFVGCGDMHFAAQLARWWATSDGVAGARALRSMDVRWFADSLAVDDFVVCSSVSGRTPRTIEAARLAREAGSPVLALTDNPDSPITEVVGSVVLGTAPPAELERGVYAGYRRQIPQTQSFTAMLVALDELVCAWTGSSSSMPDVASGMRAWLPGLEESVRASAAGVFAGAREVVVLASGPHLPVARYGAAKFLELAIPAQAQCLEEYNHLELFVASPERVTVVLAPDEASWERAAELLEPWRELGERFVVVGSEAVEGVPRVELPQVHGRELSFAVIAAVQLLAVEGGLEFGRDVDAWMGGVRTEEMVRLNLRTVRGQREE